MSDLLHIQMKDKTTHFVVWIVEVNRVEIVAVCVGEGSIGDVKFINRIDILEPKYLSTQ